MSNLPMSFQERVSAKIIETIAELIPQEDIDRLVKEQIDNFMRIHLTQFIHKEISTRIQQGIIETLKGPEYGSIWVDGKYEPANDVLKQILKEAAPEIFQSAIQSLIVNTVMNVRNNLPRY